MNALIEAAIARTRTTLLLLFMALFAGVMSLRAISIEGDPYIEVPFFQIQIFNEGISPEDVAGLDFGTFLLQPMDGDARRENTQAALDYCLIHPHWRLSLQTHKLMGIA